MKIGFVFDTVLLQDKQNFYGMTLTYDFFQQRYLDKCDKMLIITRVGDIKQYKGNSLGYKITNGKNVEVNPINEYKTILDSIKNNNAIKKHILNELKKCDKVIIRMPSVLGIFACDLCEKNNIPYMIELVACAWDGYFNHTNKFGKIIAPFMFILTKKRIEKCKDVLYVTTEFLQKRYPTKGNSYSCSDVVLADFDDNLLNKKINKMKFFDNKNFTMATVANVGMRYKGHIYALKAIKKLKNKGINIKYYLAGNGDQNFLKQKIKNLNIEENVIFLGSLEHDQIFNLLDKIDIYVQPSLQEGLPRALVEAMSRACVCVGSDVGGIPELLNKEYIFKKKKSNDLCKILEKLTVEKVIEESNRNYTKAREFEKNTLDIKRNEIYKKFMEK